MVVEADVGDGRASGDPSTVLCLLDRVDRYTVDDGLDETRGVARNKDAETAEQASSSSSSISK